MSAIITNPFRNLSASVFVSDVKDTNNSYYTFFGKQTNWDISGTPDSITDIRGEEFDARQEMLGMKKISNTDVSHVIPRVNWTSGQIYGQYNYGNEIYSHGSTDPNVKPYIVMTTSFKVYMCLKTGLDSNGDPKASTVEPTYIEEIGTEPPGPLSDGYIWKYLYTISANDVNKFVTQSFIPVKNITIEPAGTDPYYSQYLVYDQAVAGAIHRADVIEHGTGYSSITSVSVKGDGVGCIIDTTDVVLDAGRVVGINIDPANIGSGYTTATITINGNGTGAVIKPLISPIGGFGSDFIEDTKSHYVGVTAQFDQDGNGKFPLTTYRQVGLIKNPVDYSTGNIITDTEASPVKRFSYSGADPAFVTGETITGGSSTAEAIIVDVNTTDKVVRYIQNDSTGYTQFQHGEDVSNGSSVILSSIVVTGNNPDIKKNSGDILFIENRSPVTRVSDQTETVKIVVEF